MSNPGINPNSIPVGQQVVRPAIRQDETQPVPFRYLVQADAALPDSINDSGDPIKAESQEYDVYSSVSKIIGLLREPVPVPDRTSILPQIWFGTHYFSQAITQTSVGKTALQAEMRIKCTPITAPFDLEDMTWNGIDLIDQGTPTELTQGYYGGSIGAAAVHDDVIWTMGEDDPNILVPFGFNLQEKGYTLHGVIVEVAPYTFFEITSDIVVSTAEFNIARSFEAFANFAFVPGT